MHSRFSSTVVVLAVQLCLLAAPALADPHVDSPHIEILENVSRQVPADGLRFKAVVAGRGASAAEARADVDRNINDSLARLEKFELGDDSVEVFSLTIEEVVDWSVAEDKTLGYEATRDIEITLRNLDIAGQVADALMTARIAGFEDVTPFADNIDETRDEMIEEAFARARKEAGHLAAMSGRTLGEVYWISSQPDRYPRLERVQVTGSRLGGTRESTTFPAFNIRDFEVEVTVKTIFLID